MYFAFLAVSGWVSGAPHLQGAKVCPQSLQKKNINPRGVKLVSQNEQTPSEVEVRPNAKTNTALPKPRPLWRVVVLSLASGLAYYGYYKYYLEEELKQLTGKGIGGFLTVAPFVAGITGPLWVNFLGLDEQVGTYSAIAGLAWIAYWQWEFYRRVNELYRGIGKMEPLQSKWLVVPGFNIIVGLRAIHFYSEYLSFMDPQRESKPDPLATTLPFLSVHSLGILQLLTTPGLWLRLPNFAKR